MARYTELINPEAVQYILNTSVRERPLLARLREETSRLPNAIMQIPPEQGQLLQLLVRMTGAKKAIEVGVFTGYSSLSIALAMPPDGRLVACDVSQEFTSIARRYWAEAGLSNKIDLRIGPAREALAAMIAAEESGQYDFAFIDADKPGYHGYYEQCLELLRPGGVITLDNMFSHGRVMLDAPEAPEPVALKALNEFILRDERVDALLLTVGDGMTVVVKR